MIDGKDKEPVVMITINLQLNTCVSQNQTP